MNIGVLTVCTGNICRSPLAERLLGLARADLSVTSAGLSALVGHPADRDTVHVAQLRSGIVLDGHSARQFTAELGRRNDLILVMEDWQRLRISEIAPSLFGRVFLLTRWTTGVDVPDPYRRGPAVQAATHDTIAEAVTSWARRIPGTSAQVKIRSGVDT
jgi:protein-tyrosine phosphatase